MNEQVMVALLTAGGALAYNVWGLLKAAEKTSYTPAIEIWDWQRTAVTVLPSLILGFLAGYQLDLGGGWEIVSVLTSGFGIAAAQGQLGVEKFFKLK